MRHSLLKKPASYAEPRTKRFVTTSPAFEESLMCCYFLYPSATSADLGSATNLFWRSLCR